ncbi:MAG: PKD domain-containing protein, partial [Microbacterium sp.]
MSATSGRGRRFLAALATAAVIIAGSVALTAAPASAADPVPPGKAPLLQRNSDVVTSDPLPTVQINDGYVWAQTTVGNTVYAVGSFANTRPAGAAVNTNLTPRANILAFDIRTGNLISSFAPTTNGVVRAVKASPDGSRIYIGGSFNTVNGQTRYNFAALDATTGALVSGFAPSVGGTGVYAIAAAGTSVYVGGLFSQANATARKNLAGFNTASGALLPWAPETDRQVDAMVMEPGNAKVIIGGRFYQTNSQVQRGLAALDPTTGAIDTAWLAPKTVINGWSSGEYDGKAGIFGLNTDNGGVYGTGWVYANASIGNLEGVFSANAGDGSIRWVADCHGDHYGVFSTGKTVYATNHVHACETVNMAPELNPRQHKYVAAFTATAEGTLSRSASAGSTYKDWSGTPSPSAYNWVPDFTVGSTSGLGQAGLSITGNSDFISIGGEFGSVNNRLYQGLVRFATAPATGAKDGPRLSNTTWAAPTSQSVSAGVARVTIPANWDRDDLNLTYELRRAGVSAPVASKVVKSTWWNQPAVSLIDTGLTPGSSQTYTVTAKDGDGNAVTSQSVTVTIASGTASPYANAVLEDGASLLYRMGGVTQDWAGTNNASYGSGVSTTTPGALSETGSAASTFNGSTGRVSSAQTMTLSDSLSVEVWFKTNTNRGGKLVGYGTSQTGLSGSYDRHIYMANNGQLYWGAYPGAVKTVNSSASFNDNQWHHAVGTLGEDGLNLYVDGQLVGSDPTTTNGEGYTGYWRIGGDSLGSWNNQPTSNYFAGAIDEVAIYSQVLPVGQISSHYAIGKGLTPPTAGFSSTANNLAAQFDASSSTVPAGRTITGYAWNFGDGTTGTGVNATRTFTAAGTYNVTLTVTDSTGLTGSVTQPITVSAANANPTASFLTSVTGLTASTNASASTDSDGTIDSYSWNWGDSTAATTGLTSTHRYAAAGTYTVTLTVTDDRGGVATTTRSVTVTHAAPTADFTVVPSGLAVSVDGRTSSAADGATLAYSWSWGDGTADGTGSTATHTYATPGNYTVTLTLTDSLGATVSSSTPVTVSSVTYAASDSFGRTVSSGWGAAEIGGAWSALYGAASAASVSGGVGQIALPAGQTRNMALSGVSVRDAQ